MRNRLTLLLFRLSSGRLYNVRLGLQYLLLLLWGLLPLQKTLAGMFAYVGRVTWNGLRDVQRYVHGPEAVEHRCEEVAGIAEYRPEVMVTYDPDWQCFAELLYSIQGAA